MLQPMHSRMSSKRPSLIFTGRNGSEMEGRAAPTKSSHPFLTCLSMLSGDVNRPTPTTGLSVIFFTYEIYQFNNVDSIDMIAKLIKAVDRKQFGVHLDLTNLINCPRNYWKSGELMKECIKQFGDLIVTAHAKDVRMLEPSITVNFDEVIPGEGMLDIATLVRELHKLPQVVPYMMEHLKTEEEYDRASSNIRNIAANEGILI